MERFDAAIQLPLTREPSVEVRARVIVRKRRSRWGGVGAFKRVVGGGAVE